jgi:hypothetical protein
MQKAHSRVGAAVFFTIFQSRIILLEPAASRLQQQFGRGKWWVATVPPRALRFKRPLHRCNACNPFW